MKPRRTVKSNFCFILSGGNEDNDLWVERINDYGTPIIASHWFPDEQELQMLTEGAAVKLLVWGSGHPPVALSVEKVEAYRA